MVRRRALCAALFTALCLVAADLPSAGASQASDEGRLMSSINRERARQGVPSLRSSGELASIARKHSARMAASRRIYHNPNLGRQTSGWTYVGENVGAGTSADAVHRAFMRDAGHRRNILDRGYSDAGVGVAYHGTTVYVTQVFAYRQRVDPKPRVSRARPVKRRSAASARQSAPVVTAPPPAQPPAQTIRSVTLILRLLALDEPIAHAPPPSLFWSRRRNVD